VELVVVVEVVALDVVVVADDVVADVEPEVDVLALVVAPPAPPPPALLVLVPVLVPLVVVPLVVPLVVEEAVLPPMPVALEDELLEPPELQAYSASKARKESGVALNVTVLNDDIEPPE
jgi:hypothetical protein